MSILLAGDIGGTKSALALVNSASGPREPLAKAEFPSGEYRSLEAIVREFLHRATSYRLDAACFGVAGPVISGQVKVTNLPWTVSETRLRAELGIANVRLLNDVQATAQAIPSLQPSELDMLTVGAPVPGGAIALIAAGTGLGEAFLTWNGSSYKSQPSEGGHVDFAPTSSEQSDLLEYMKQHFDHVSYERVCSGIGIPNIYDYLRNSGYSAETPAIAAALRQASDRTPPIVDGALDPDPCQLCVKSLELFASILGTEAGNLGLKVMATGGIYLGGGIPKRILPILREGRFLQSLRDKGRLSHLLAEVPVGVITGDAALLGASICGLALFDGAHGA